MYPGIQRKDEFIESIHAGCWTQASATEQKKVRRRFRAKDAIEIHLRSLKRTRWLAVNIQSVHPTPESVLCRQVSVDYIQLSVPPTYLVGYD